MIRSALAYANAVIGTLFFGAVAMVAAAFRVRGRVYFWATSNWGRCLLWGSGARVHVHGLDRVDWSRPHVLVANHTANFEILAIAATVPAPYHFVAKKELERIPFFGGAWKAAGHISIDRGNRQKAMESLRLAAQIIRRDGGIVIIFPEGTRSPDGELQAFKKGAFQLAVEAGVPIIPTIVTGSDRIMRGGTLRVRPGTMDLYVGDPISVQDFTPERMDELIALVRRTMAEMLTAARTREREVAPPR